MTPVLSFPTTPGVTATPRRVSAGETHSVLEPTRVAGSSRFASDSPKLNARV